MVWQMARYEYKKTNDSDKRVVASPAWNVSIRLLLVYTFSHRKRIYQEDYLSFHQYAMVFLFVSMTQQVVFHDQNW